jgi:hypothetical protein
MNSIQMNSTQMNSPEIYGVVNGVYICNNDRVDELNDRIYDRNIPSQKLQSQFDIRPVSSKYAMMPIFDRRAIPTVPIERMPTYNVGEVFNPGNAQAPWSGFATKIDDDSRLRNQFFAIQKANQAYYIPPTTSDMYKVEVVGQSIQQPFPDLFYKPVFEPFNPNICDVGGNIFYNCIRQQTKNCNKC